MSYANVDELPEDSQLLDSTLNAARYSTGPEDSQWFCGYCGVAVDDESEPCAHCDY